MPAIEFAAIAMMNAINHSIARDIEAVNQMIFAPTLLNASHTGPSSLRLSEDGRARLLAGRPDEIEHLARQGSDVNPRCYERCGADQLQDESGGFVLGKA